MNAGGFNALLVICDGCGTVFERILQDTGFSGLLRWIPVLNADTGAMRLVPETDVFAIRLCGPTRELI